MKSQGVDLPGAVLASPPVRGRGLKLLSLRGRQLECLVAPCAGAWVEISVDFG